MTGGEPFAFDEFLERIVPGLIERTRHTVSVLTNLSANVQTLANQAAVALERSILLVESREQAKQIESAYAQLSQTYDLTPKFDAVFRMVRGAHRYAGCDTQDRRACRDECPAL